MAAFPPVIRNNIGANIPAGVFERGNDPVKYVAGRSRFERPSLRVAPNGPEFEWPMGVEGMRISGSVGTAQHLYLGDNAPVVQIVHRDARRFELRGMFAGITGAINMRDLLDVITADVPQGYWILKLPASIFPKEQLVVVESYDLDHPEEERNDGFAYSVVMVRTGVGTKVPGTKTVIEPNNPVGSTQAPSRGVTGKTFTTTTSIHTLRGIASVAYGDPDKWKLVYDKNRGVLGGISLIDAQFSVLAPGIKFNI